jgi:type VI secretion system protein ImpK
MQDNPFAEPDDDDRTIVRPSPGGRRAAAPVAAQADDATRIAPPPRPRKPAPPAPPIEQPVALPKAAAVPLVAAAAPLLQLLARLRNTLTPPDAGDLHGHTVREVRAFEDRAREAGVPAHLLRLAHYALCASLDDVVLNTPWGSGSAWDSRSLVSSFHQEVRGGERFFDILDLARQTPARFLPVLELMYLCLSLGFMGRYRLSPRGMAEIDQLREAVFALLAANRARPDAELSPAWRGVAAPYSPARPRVPLWVAGSAALAAAGGLFVWCSISLNAASDAVYETALHIAPATMPAITRDAPVAPVAGTAEPGALERLRAFLEPEIGAGTVAVLGTQDAPIVRVRQSMFATGSASVQPASAPLLERIGVALKSEPGTVDVVGYTDATPIRTVRFPSNFQLSQARAEAARDVLAHTIGDAARLSSEGRADADPIAPNTTAEGRDANRRIEIILHRSA